MGLGYVRIGIAKRAKWHYYLTEIYSVAKQRASSESYVTYDRTRNNCGGKLLASFSTNPEGHKNETNE